MTNAFSYSRGVSKFDNCPEQLDAATFADFRDAILSDRSTAKGQAYVCGPCLPAPDDAQHRKTKRKGTGSPVVGQPYRSAATAGTRRFAGLDVDTIPNAAAMQAMCEYMKSLSAFGYTTWSHAPDAPRMRWMVELDREVSRAECVDVTAALRRRMVAALGFDGFDKSLDRPEQPIYTPGMGAEVFVCEGEPLSVAAMLAETAPKSGEIIPSPHRAQGHGADANNDQVIQRATADPSTGHAFAALWAGDGSNYASPSEADIALMGMLWNASGTADQCLRMFEGCSLYRPDKARKSRGYYEKTLAKVMQTPARVTKVELDAADPCTDKANAIRIRDHLGADLHFVTGIGWALWNGTRWDTRGLPALGYVTQHLDHIVRAEAVALAKHEQMTGTPKEFQRAGNLFKFAKHSGDLMGIRRAMSLAEPMLAVAADALDKDPWMLGCNNGTVDLRTGELRAPDRGDLITKSTRLDYDPGATAPTWDAFLARIFRGNPEIIPFLQRLAGFWLTGLTDPQLLVVLYGTGNNGKTTMVKTLAAAMGDYAGPASPDLLMVKHGGEHPTGMADLQALRFVYAAESGEGGRLNEERVKALTGSDTIKARKMHQNFYSFEPTHKLALLTNHKPLIRGRDEGIWRRVKLVPHMERIPDDEVDPTLVTRLAAECPGIFRWMVDGARQFHEAGGRLELPEVVKAATQDYRSESDVLGMFVEEEGAVDATATIGSAELYAVYEAWCDDNGERPMSKRTLGLRLQEMGFTPAKDRRGTRLWRGLRLAGREGAKYR